MSSPSDLTHEDVTRILRLIDEMQDVEVRLEVAGMKLHVRKFSSMAALSERPSLDTPTVDETSPARPASAQAPVAASSAPVVAERTAALPTSATAASSDVVAIRAPMLGRVFRAPSPTEPAYVEVGSKVEPDDTVCIIEVMKLFNTVKAGVRGTIAQISIENGAMVEYEAVLFLVKQE